MITFDVVFALIFLFGAAAALLLLIRGLDFLWFAKDALLLTAAFAVICTAFVLIRGLRSGSSASRRIGWPAAHQVGPFQRSNVNRRASLPFMPARLRQEVAQRTG